MNRELEVLELRAGMEICLPNGDVSMVLRPTSDHGDGTATIHTDEGDLPVALPCVATLDWAW